MALELAIVGVAGMTLGLRHNVLVLVPGVAVAMLFGMMIGIAHDEHFWSIILGMVILGTAVQIGYLAGIAIRAIAGSLRTPLITGRNPQFNSQIGRT